MLLGILVFIFVCIALFTHLWQEKKDRIIPISVNYHFTRKCNYECGFCFHTAKTSNRASLDDAKKALHLLKAAGMKKINFAGGEPFLYANFLGDLVRFCKVDLGLESVSIVSNGSKIREEWLEKYGQHLDILAVSCDSFDEATNKLIGRGEPGHTSADHIEKVRCVAKWCQQYKIRFKVNTVVNSFNFNEDMNEQISILQPFRWKCFQVLVVEGENDSDDTLRNASKFLISDEQFEGFCKRHEGNKCFVPEPNNLMRNSYLILDENLCFLNHAGATTQSTKSIREVGVQKALLDAGWDEDSFVARGGVYDWTKSQAEGCGTGNNPALDW